MAAVNDVYRHRDLETDYVVTKVEGSMVHLAAKFGSATTIVPITDLVYKWEKTK